MIHRDFTEHRHTTASNISRFAIALLTFVGINGVLFLSYGRARALHVKPCQPRAIFDWPLKRIKLWDEAAIDSAVSDMPEQPTVVMEGSSAMMVPFWKVDREIDHSVSPRLWLHHEMIELETESSCSAVPKPVIYNLSTPLQMLSDSYIYTNELLKGQRRPSILLVGVTPREFYDHDFPTPDKTLNFLAAAPFLNWRYTDICCLNAQSKGEYLLEQLCFLLSKRGFLQTTLDCSVHRLAHQLLPCAAANDNAQFCFGTEQYSRRYHGATQAKFGEQLSFLIRLSNICRDRDIELAIINLPVPSSNKYILGSSVYEQYRQMVRETLDKCHGDVDYIDLSQSPLFSDADFQDSIHLNASGGWKLVGVLAPYIKRELAHGKHIRS